MSADCNTCPLYLAAAKFCATSTPRRTSSAESAYTVPGRLIAAGARAKGLTVREVSIRIGRAGDYLPRVCRGKLALNGPTAYAVGALLRIEIGQYVGYMGGDGPVQEPKPGLPLRFTGQAVTP